MAGVKEFRENQNMRQEDFASILSMSKVNYCKKENGKVKFSLNEAYLLSNHFGVPIETIFGNETISE